MSHALFMVGEQRSGSNLLRVMLGQADEIAAPHPPHILERMMPLIPHYGDLQPARSLCDLGRRCVPVGRTQSRAVGAGRDL